MVTQTWEYIAEQVGGSLRKVFTVPVVGPLEEAVLPPQPAIATTINDKIKEVPQADII